MRSFIEKFRHSALGVLKTVDWFPLLLARMTVGILFVSTGWGKVNNIDKIVGYFTELKIPMPALNAVLASYTELICGALLVFGLASRLAAVPLIVTMIVALLTALRSEIHSLPDLFGKVEFTYIVLLIVIVVFGPGKASIDRFIAKRLE